MKPTNTTTLELSDITLIRLATHAIGELRERAGWIRTFSHAWGAGEARDSMIRNAISLSQDYRSIIQAATKRFGSAIFRRTSLRGAK